MGMAFRESMLYVRDRIKHPMRVVEIGVFQGGNAMRLLTLNLEKLYLVDPYESYVQYKQDKPWYVQKKLNDAKEIMLGRVANHPLKDKVEIVIKSSTEAAKQFPDNFFDYVYIDGNHSYDFVMADIKAWYPKVKKGGYIAGHDYATVDTAKAVQDFAKENNIKVFESWCTPGEIQAPDWTKDWLMQKE